MMEGTPRRSPFPSLTLVGTPRFRPFRNVWMLEELRDALPVEVGFRYDHTVAAPQSDEARTHHPMGKVPSLLVRDSTEGDFTLIESAAINSWLGDRMREYVIGGDSGFLVPRPGSRDRAMYDSFVQFLVAEADSSGLWIHRKLESLGEKKAFGAVRYALLPARLQFDRAMAGEYTGLQPVAHAHAQCACACAHAPHKHTLGLQVRNEMEGLMGKLEKDLTESLIKVILQSRVTKRKTDVRLRSPSVSPSGRRSGSCKSLFSAGSARSEASGVGSEEGAVPET